MTPAVAIAIVPRANGQLALANRPEPLTFQHERRLGMAAPLKRSADVVWEGTIARGAGQLSGGSGAFSGFEVTAASRLGEPEGKTTPEELIAAAHATCFTMALGSILAGRRTPPERLAVNAVVTLEDVDGRITITTSELDVVGRVDGIDQAAFERATHDAELSCPVSRALAGNVEIRTRSRLEDSVPASS
jgi:osmotically inducible protein OsmC